MDLYQYYGQDLSVDSIGSLLLTDGITLSQQRILRRLLTNPGDYIFHLDYGAGLPRFIGKALSLAVYNEIVGLITTNMFLETSVAQSPPPVITLTANQNTIYVSIQYTDAPTQTLQVLSFNVSAN